MHACARSLAFEAVREQARLHGTPLILLSNKQDLPDALTESEIGDKFEVHKMMNIPFRVHLMSALTG